MAFGVTVSGTPVPISTVERAGAGFEDVIAQTRTDGKVENFVRHKMGGL
jgi:hypothetical protein